MNELILKIALRLAVIMPGGSSFKVLNYVKFKMFTMHRRPEFFFNGSVRGFLDQNRFTIAAKQRYIRYGWTVHFGTNKRGVLNNILKVLMSERGVQVCNDNKKKSH